MRMNFTLDSSELSLDLTCCIVAGWTGRDAAAVQNHIDELSAIGVPPPSSVPLYYRIGSMLLTQNQTIEVLGSHTSGEIEPLLIATEGRLYLGLASDHSDRALETHSVAHAKQICAKPVAIELWAFDEIKAHVAQIEMRSWIREGDRDDWALYQDGSLASIRPLPELIADSGLINMADNGKDAALLCGTIPARGGVRPAAGFKMALYDPMLDRTIEQTYTISVLPVIA